MSVVRDAGVLADTERRLAVSERGWAETRRRLAETDEMLRALRHGEVDALVISDGQPGEQVFTLSSADRPYRMFVENMSDGAATVSDTGVVLYANPRLAGMLACSVQIIVGAQITSFIAGGDISLQTGRTGVQDTIELDLVAEDGRRVPVLVGTANLDVEGDRLTCLTFTDLTARKVQEEVIGRLNQAQIVQLKELQEAQAALTLRATHDPLTGLPNRLLFIDRVEQALTRAFRNGTWTAVLFVDLDRFKHINDSRGHAAGDDVLRRVAQRLKAVLRPMDTVARIGGDEFVVLSPDLADQMQAVDIAQRLLTGLEDGLDPATGGDTVTASIGISLAGAGEATAELMLAEADTAMYHAKSLGSNRAELFDSALSRRAVERATAEDSLRRAVDEHRVVAHYQPIIDLTTGQVAGFEALARLIQDGGDVIYPDSFINVAEESGLIIPLGAQMLLSACRDAHQWHEQLSAQPSPTVAVNLSPRQLERSDLAAEVRAVLAQTDLEPHRLHLEITETALMELRPEVLRQLDRVRDLGVEIGLDDFGTGYASLTHLRRLPVTFVKVDRSFIAGLGQDIEDERIVAAVIELTASLNLRSIAEGIETPEQLHRLRELGCDQAQGYLFARPAPSVELQRTYVTS